MGTTPPWMVAQSGTNFYDPVEVRQLTVVPLGSYAGDEMAVRPGVFPGGNPWKVTVAASVWTVRRGTGVVDGPPGSGTGYLVALPADETGAVNAADTSARKDIIVVEVTAAADGVGRARYIAGVPAASPAEPAVPAGALKVATLDVAASGAGGAVAVTDTRQFSVPRGAVLPVASAMPAPTYPGMLAYGLAQDRLLVRNAADTATNTIWQPQQKAGLSLLAGWPQVSASRPVRYTLDPAAGFVTLQGRLIRAVNSPTWEARSWNTITGELPAAIRPAESEYWAATSRNGIITIRYNATLQVLEGRTEAASTWTVGVDWISLSGILYYL